MSGLSRNGVSPQDIELEWWIHYCCTVCSNRSFLLTLSLSVGSVSGQPHNKLLMVVPRHRMSTVGRRAFAVHGPMVWNSLLDDLRAQQDYESFRQGLKTWLFSRY